MTHSTAPARRERAASTPPSRLRTAIAFGAAGLAIAALVNHELAKKAEQDNPPAGNFIEIGGVRLHYLDRGEGDVLVLLHGNGSMIQDFEASGLIDRLAERHRVIVFDRPGYGHSARPLDRVWSAQAQAEVIHEALVRLGIERASVFGHSWGASVAACLAASHPETVRALILASGYYFPSVRADVLLLSGPAVPILGDVLRYTLAPILVRLAWPLLMRKMFGPSPEPAKFRAFPKEMALRPSQIRASAVETAYLIPDAIGMPDYRAMRMPVTILAGDSDRIVDPNAQAMRLHREIAHSTLRIIPGEGHMIHQTATEDVLAAIEEAMGAEAGPLSRAG